MATLISCLFCKKLFTPSRDDNRIKYCSPYCRNAHWPLLNPGKSKAHKKKYLKKIKVFCKVCKGEVPDYRRAGGVTHCSEECILFSRKQKSAKQNTRARESMKAFKESTGCCRCGYKTFYGSMDFHHVDPSKKERKIDIKAFLGKSAIILAELSKCILVCKNCHYELHEKYRKDLIGYEIEIAAYPKATSFF